MSNNRVLNNQKRPFIPHYAASNESGAIGKKTEQIPSMGGTPFNLYGSDIPSINDNKLNNSRA